MNPTFRKVALIAAVLGFAVSVAVAACGSDDDEASPATTQAPPTTTEALPTTEAPPTTTDEPGTVTTAPENDRETIRITVVGGRPQGGIERPEVDQGDRVTLLVTSDVSDHVHLHGYDLMADAGPGTTARIVFRADVPGRFEIELEDRGIQIAELTVSP
jgi:FtsP/CotA-like multicopper oxidase with cupredoxin domain